MGSTVEGPEIDELARFAGQTLRQMGQSALNFYGRGVRKILFDQNLVTQAEITLNNAFAEQMATHYPRHQLFGQSGLDDAYSHTESRFLWVFDPLDGVDNFQSGIPLWGMSLALYENHWPLLGLFFMPATNDMFFAQAGRRAMWNDRPIAIGEAGTFTQESVLLTYSRFHQNFQSLFPGKIRCFGSTGAHACYVAMGRAAAAVAVGESFKDLAAVRIIVEAAGGNLYQIDGKDFYLGEYVDGRRIEEPVIIADHATMESVRSTLKRM